MKVHEFFGQYANIPLDKRGLIINFAKYGPKTMTDVYIELHDLEDTMRPMRIREERLLQMADEFLTPKPW